MSAEEQIPLAQPEIGAREEELALEVLRSGRLSLGPMGERFERDFGAWLGSDDAVAVSSGTTALHLGVRALGWGPGDEVLTSPFSFVASANCLLYEGARPVFCDVDPVTLNLDPSAAAAAVGERTRGILPIHIFGYPAAMPALEALAAANDLGILEDACEALGAVDSEGRKVGTRGNLATFAFYANKQMTTGEGGMIVPNDAAAAARLRSEPELKEEAVVICEGNGSAARVAAATRKARKVGIEPGMTLPQARARLPRLIARGRDLSCERSAQQTLLEVAESFSPRVEDAGEGVAYLDLAGHAALAHKAGGDEPRPYGRQP